MPEPDGGGMSEEYLAGLLHGAIAAAVVVAVGVLLFTRSGGGSGGSGRRIEAGGDTPAEPSRNGDGGAESSESESSRELETVGGGPDPTAVGS